MKNVAFFLFLFISLLGHSQSKVVKIDNLSLKDLNDFEGYQVFDSLLKDKKYVFLGESAHVRLFYQK